MLALEPVMFQIRLVLERRDRGQEVQHVLSGIRTGQEVAATLQFFDAHTAVATEILPRDHDDALASMKFEAFAVIERGCTIDGHKAK